MRVFRGKMITKRKKKNGDDFKNEFWTFLGNEKSFGAEMVGLSRGGGVKG
jgi:hypothetical protein